MLKDHMQIHLSAEGVRKFDCTPGKHIILPIVCGAQCNKLKKQIEELWVRSRSGLPNSIGVPDTSHPSLYDLNSGLMVIGNAI